MRTTELCDWCEQELGGPTVRLTNRPDYRDPFSSIARTFGGPREIAELTLHAECWHALRDTLGGERRRPARVVLDLGRFRLVRP